MKPVFIYIFLCRTSSAQPLVPTEDMIMLKDEALHGLLDFLVTMSVHSITDPNDKNLTALNNILGVSTMKVGLIKWDTELTLIGVSSEYARISGTVHSLSMIHWEQ